MAKHGKKYREAAAKIDSNMFYGPKEAIALVKETSYTSFDGTVELHVRLGVDPRHADQAIRETVMLPHGLGKTVRVVVFADGEGARIAEQAGADFIADDEMIEKIKNGWLDFDAAVATPTLMGKIGKAGLGRVLGPRGLMPNPKAGTVVQDEDIPRAIEELKAGRVEFRVDRTGNLHIPFGKASFEVDQLYDNMSVLMEAIRKARPASVKGMYIKRVSVTATMAPGIRIDLSQIREM
ncbi:MAG: 50S ribosomal protein L1 [Anaerolineales bacterium]|nr:50S ribosomal protein L1 [Anaerolineales bacterium]